MSFLLALVGKKLADDKNQRWTKNKKLEKSSKKCCGTDV